MKKCGLVAVSCGSALVSLGVYWIIQVSMPIQLAMSMMLIGAGIASLGCQNLEK